MIIFTNIRITSEVLFTRSAKISLKDWKFEFTKMQVN